jgi:hypothetical protein
MTIPVTLSTRDLAVFPADYSHARKGLRLLAKRSSLLRDTLAFPVEDAAGEDDEPLSTEIIWLGPRSAQNLVVLISATHGVEGFVGAAVQSDLMLRLEQNYRLPGNTAVLIIFALNAYGFSRCRRCDEAGIDLNRNFIDFDSPPPANDGYERLQEAIYCEDGAQRHRLFEAFRQQWGQTAYEIAISGGQYTDPYGPFYGGRAPAHGRKVVEQLIAHYQLDRFRLAVVDIHSGLGPYAHGELINDHPIGSNGFRVANQWYGASAASPAAGDSSSVSKLGLLDYRWHELMAQHGCYVTLEFGSYRTQDLFDVVLQDHRSWKSGNSRAISASAAAMKAHFCPADVYWRELVLVKSRQVIQQAIEGLNHDQ